MTPGVALAAPRGPIRKLVATALKSCRAGSVLHAEMRGNSGAGASGLRVREARRT